MLWYKYFFALSTTPSFAAHLWFQFSFQLDICDEGLQVYGNIAIAEMLPLYKNLDGKLIELRKSYGLRVSIFAPWKLQVTCCNFWIELSEDKHVLGILL